MSDEIRLTSVVGTGGRIEIAASGLPEGLPVEVVLHFDVHAKAAPKGILDYFYSLPPGPHSAATWNSFEEDFESERNGWN